MVNSQRQSNIKFDPQLLLNVLGLLAVAAILSLTFYIQFVRGELPCPLCMLQRAGFMLVGLGLLMNIRYGISLTHYAMSILGALFAGKVALRQVALHVSDEGYGDTFLNGWHYYTWSFVLAVLAVVAICVVMMLPHVSDRRHLSKGLLKVGAFVAAFFFLLVLLNFVFTFFQCKFGLCDPNPEVYELFSSAIKTSNL